jgi:hypothetical protein
MKRYRTPGLRLARLVAALTTVVAAVALGTATVQADVTTSSAAAQIACTAPAWNPNAIYEQSSVVSHVGHQWRASHWMWPGVEPGVSGAPPYWVPWADLGPCAPATTTEPPGSTTTTTAPPGQGVEETFEARGPWAVTTGTASAPGTPGVRLYYPSNLGADGDDHPLLTHGNGTGAACPTGPDGGFLGHFASWGFVVVCAESGETGLGGDVLAAAQWLVGQDDNPSSVFFDKLDTSKVGAIGGSQGASGAVNAMLQSDGLITSTVAVALVDPTFQYWSGFQPSDFSQVQDPLFLISGTADFLTSQEWQQTYYDRVPGPAAKAALVGVGHNPEGRDLAYGTAWFKYTLEGDPFAGSAFVATGGNPPEVSTNPAWTNWAAKNLL